MAEPAVVTTRPGRRVDPGCPEQVTRTGQLRVTAVFAGFAGQVCHARRLTEALLIGWPLAGGIVLVVPGLAANAVVHSASHDGGTFRVHLETFSGGYVPVEVRDESSPRVQRRRDGRSHGLDIIGTLAADFGVAGDARSGWIAWVRLELPKPGIIASEADLPCARVVSVLSQVPFAVIPCRWRWDCMWIMPCLILAASGRPAPAGDFRQLPGVQGGDRPRVLGGVGKP